MGSESIAQQLVRMHRECNIDEALKNVHDDMPFWTAPDLFRRLGGDDALWTQAHAKAAAEGTTMKVVLLRLVTAWLEHS